MIKGKEILNRPIVAISTGEKVDTVRDVVFDHQGNQVLAFLTDEGGWFRAAKAVPFDRVRSIGEHAVMIATPDDVTTSRDDKRLGDALESKTSLLGLTLLTTDGQNLGRIADVYFDEHTGAVVGYEATGGLFADLSSGRTFIPAPSDVQIGSDAAIVPLDVAAAMKEHPGGIRGALKGASEAVTGAVHNVGDTVTGAVQDAGHSVRSSYDSAAGNVRGAVQQASEAVNDRQQDYVVGKVSNAEIVAADGTVIIRPGETITPLHAEVAEWHGKLPALVAAATGGTLAAGSSSLGESLREKVQQVRSSVQESYADATQAAKDRQKALLVGKIAGVDIILDNGMPIVHKGDVITAAQADAAEHAGKLMALTASVTGGTLGEAVQDVRERVQPAAPAPLMSSQGAHYVYDIQAATGRRVRQDVRAPGGSLLAVQGQIVTPELVQKAESLGLGQVLVEATLGDANPAAQTAQHAVADASAALTDGVEQVKEGASNLLNKARAWLSERRDETEQAFAERESEFQQQRIRDALGRPVTRVILAPDDSIILNVGEIITNKAVQAARAGNVLDMLLDSASKDAPVIDPIAVRPDETGAAALDSQPDLKK